MKIGMIIILWFCLTGGLVVAQEKRAYTLFDADGQETDYAHMMSVLGEQQVVFIGEIHNCPIAHWMEYEIVRDLYALHKDRLMIGAEMFERDDQLVLDEYLSGLITAERFTKEAKLRRAGNPSIYSWSEKFCFDRIFQWSQSQCCPVQPG